MSASRAETLKEKRALEKAYEDGFDVIFNYWYGCCAFAHNIYGSHLEVLDGMPDTSKMLTPEFFINPQCPPSAIPTEAAPIGVHSGKMTNAPEKEASAAILVTDHSKVGKHLSAKVEPSKEPAFLT